LLVCREEERQIRTLRGWGFEPIPCRFYDFETIGGGFHCASVDIRRRGGLQSYF
jgi:glycine amidinotransferase